MADENTVTTASGLQYEDLTIGDGAEAAAGQFVSVHYTGWLQNDDGSPGEKFDSSVDRDEPFEFSLGAGQVIKGWEQAFALLPVGTKATVKAVLPESMKALGAQAILANAYHLYLQPGADIVDAAGGLGQFMGWSGPTFTDSGGFQVMSLKELRKLDPDGVTFRSPIDGTEHRLTPEKSIEIQHQLDAEQHEDRAAARERADQAG